MRHTIFILLFFTVFACENLLETDPTESIDLDVAVNSESGLNGFLMDFYDDMQLWQLYGSLFICGPDLMADNLDFLRTTTWHENYWGNRSTLGWWDFSYNSINKANIIIENGERLRANPDNSSQENQRLDQLIGQGYALRALFHFHLANAYAYTPTAIVEGKSKGGIPLLLEPVTALTDVAPQGRASIAEVFEQMIADMQEAIQILGNEHSAAVNNGLIGQAATQGLLSRIALYGGQWDLAAEAATAAIQSQQATLSTRSSYAADWNAVYHPEALFTLVFQINEPVDINTALQRLYTSLNANNPSYSGDGAYVPGASYLALLDSNDVRWETMQMGRNGRYETTKFTGDGGATYVDNIPIVRLSEMYLNRAEAYAQMGRAAEAIADLDLLRQRALGDSFTPTTATGEELLEAIYTERRRELAFEGHRWYDLKRWGRDIDKRDLSGEYIEFETDFRWLAPIPQRELELNPNLEQNFGYN